MYRRLRIRDCTRVCHAYLPRVRKNPFPRVITRTHHRLPYNNFANRLPNCLQNLRKRSRVSTGKNGLFFFPEVVKLPTSIVTPCLSERKSGRELFNAEAGRLRLIRGTFCRHRMASVLIPRSSISIEEAEQQFDLLFDEYFKVDYDIGLQKQCLFVQGEDKLESGAAEEADEVYLPGEQQEPQQVAQREAICQVAQDLRALGDQYTKKYGPSLARADTTLTDLFTKATSLEYETFKNTVESLTTPDRNTADFVFMMCLSRNVVSHVGNVANKAKNYFRRYIGLNYIGQVAQAGGVKEYVQQ